MGLKLRSSTNNSGAEVLKSSMNLIVTILLTQFLLITSITTQKTSDVFQVFHHYGSFPGYYRKYKMSLTTTTVRPVKNIAFRVGEFYPVDESKLF